MHLRRTTALALGSLALTVPLLGGCGFHYATERPYTPAAGVNERADTMNVLGAVLVASKPDQGTLVATLVNNSPTKALELQSVGAGTGADVQASLAKPISVASQANVNLADGQGIDVTGTFGAGDFVPLTFTFSDGSTVDLSVPVVTNCGWYDGQYAASSSPSASPVSGKAGKGASPSAGESMSPMTSESPSASSSDEPGTSEQDYTCEWTPGATPSAPPAEPTGE